MLQLLYLSYNNIIIVTLQLVYVAVTSTSWNLVHIIMAMGIII